MKIGWGRKVAAGIALVAASGTSSGNVGAQEATGSAFSVTGEVRSTFEIDDNGRLAANSSGTDLTFGTDVDLLAVLETPRSSLTFGFGVTLQAEDLARGSEENGVVDPRLKLDYRLEGPDSLFTVSADYRSRDIDDSFSFDTDGDLVDDIFLSSVGEVEAYGFGAVLSLGIEAPFGADFSLSRRERDYSNTVSPDLYDSTTDTARITARFRPIETAVARVYYEEVHYDADDAVSTDRVTRTVGVGADYEINPVLTFSGEIGWTEVDEDAIVLGVPVTVTSEDYTIDASLTQDMPNGTIAVALKRDVSTNTARTALSAQRNLDLPAGSLSFGFGVSGADEGRTALTGFVDYTRELPSAVIAVSAARTARILSDNDQVATTRLGLSYDRELTRTSGLIFGLDYFESEDIGSSSATEGSRADLSLTYRQELTEEWDWTLGYVGRRTESAAGIEATSNALVFSVGRSFSLRP